MSVVRKQTQQQKGTPGASSFYSSNLKTASESPGFNKTKRTLASPAPSSIIINNKKQQHSTITIATTTITITTVIEGDTLLLCHPNAIQQ